MALLISILAFIVFLAFSYLIGNYARQTWHGDREDKLMSLFLGMVMNIVLGIILFLFYAITNIFLTNEF